MSFVQQSRRGHTRARGLQSLPSRGLYIERHNEAFAILGKAIMEGAKGGCLTTLLANAGRHGRVTRVAANDRIPQQILSYLSDVPGSILQRMRPDILGFRVIEQSNRRTRSAGGTATKVQRLLAEVWRQRSRAVDH